MLSSPLGNRRPNCPSAQLPLAEIRRSDYKVFQDFAVGIFKGHQSSLILRGGAFATQQGDDWSYACEFSTWDVKLKGLCFAVCYLFKKLKLPTYPSPEPTCCLKWEVSVNAGLGGGGGGEAGRWVGGQFPRNVKWKRTWHPKTLLDKSSW